MADSSLVLLVRHAKAEKKHELGDYARALTDDGRDVFRLHAQALARLCKIKVVVTSPLVRAVQTAEITASAFNVHRVGVRVELALSADGRHLVELARELGAGHALVGHNPSMEEAAMLLLGLKKLPFKFKKGAALALHKQGKSFRFAWFHSPGDDVLRSLPA